MMSTFKLVSGILLAIFVLFSLLPYGEKTNPKVDPKLTLQAPKPVMDILKRSCYDCHSNQTKWPWYSSVFPMSWSVMDHVKNGRRALNFDLWNKYEEEKRWEALEEIVEKTKAHKMPLPSYLWLHSEAKLTKKDLQILEEWAQNAEDED